MAYHKVHTVLPAIAAAATSSTITFPLRGSYGAPIGFKASCVADNATTIQLADGAGLIFYLDAADKNYTTAIDKYIVWDNTVTGLTTGIPTDLTGVAIGAALGSGQPVIQSPITVTWTNGTAADILTLDFYYEDDYERTRISLTTPNPAATVSKTVNLRAEYTRILMFNFTCVTDGASKVKITDADSRVVYLDAADKDYHAAGGITKSLVLDDTLTGLGPQSLDATGAAMAANESGGAGTAVIRSPITVEWSNNGTAGDIGTFTAWYKL